MDQLSFIFLLFRYLVFFFFILLLDAGLQKILLFVDDASVGQLAVLLLLAALSL